MITSFSDDRDEYEERRQVMKHTPLGKYQVYGENVLISAFGNGVSIPKLESVEWGTDPGPTAEERRCEEEEGHRLTSELDKINMMSKKSMAALEHFQT